MYEIKKKEPSICHAGLMQSMQSWRLRAAGDPELGVPAARRHLQRTPLQTVGIYQKVDYYGKLGVVEVVRPETMAYADGI